MTTQTQTQTDDETKVEQSVLKVVKDFVQADNKAKAAADTRDSKYWPMADEAINLIHVRKMTPEEVRAQFIEALIKANGFKTKKDVPSVKMTSYRLITGRIIKLAAKGSEWIEENKAKGITGIWKMLDQITGEEAAATEDVVQKGKEAEVVAKANKRNKVAPKAKVSKYKKAAKSGTVTVKGGVEEKTTDQEAAITLDFLLNHPEELIQVIEQMLEDDVLSSDAWAEIIEKINNHLAAPAK